MTPEEKDRLKTNIFNSVDFSLSGSAWSEVCRCINEMPEENEPPVATSEFERRITRLEKLALNILTGSTVRTSGEMNFRVARDQREFIYKTWRDIIKEMPVGGEDK